MAADVSTFQAVFMLTALSIVIVCLLMTCYWLHGASLNYRAAAAYRAGDFDLGDELKRRARRWTVGARP